MRFSHNLSLSAASCFETTPRTWLPEPEFAIGVLRFFAHVQHYWFQADLDIDGSIEQDRNV
jgi:hypothetical protein